MRQWWAANNDINNRRHAAAAMHRGFTFNGRPPACMPFHHGGFDPFQRFHIEFVTIVHHDLKMCEVMSDGWVTTTVFHFCKFGFFEALTWLEFKDSVPARLLIHDAGLGLGVLP